MYKENFIVAIYCDGKSLREHGDTVQIPFGKTYEVYLKNQNSRDALVHITVDGKTVIDNLIVRAGKSGKVERFHEGSSDTGHKLKFIAMTDKIADARGEYPEDGLLRVEWKFAKKKTPTMKVEEHHHHHWTYRPEPTYPVGPGIWRWDGTTIYEDTWKNPSVTCEPAIYNESNEYQKTLQADAINSSDISYASTASLACESTSVNCSTQLSVNRSVGDAGITVNGGYSDQKFTNGSIDALEDESHVICLKMTGIKHDGSEVEVANVAREKKTCPTCHTKNSSKNKFCGECGTCLI